jgi:hypothetical protein
MGKRLASRRQHGAHYTGRPVPREDAEDALAFAEALLDHIYVLREEIRGIQGTISREQRASTEPRV